uniref:Nonsense-mediated mRNA decay factor SMG8 n=1 Tax=Alexandrium monilatum TaxID=311494 RepID=A0A6T0Z2Z5_9DINO
MASQDEDEGCLWSGRQSRLAFSAKDEPEGAREERILQHSQGHEHPLVIVGVFGKSAGGALSAAGLLDQVHLRDSEAVCCELGDSKGPFSRLQASYKDQDNVLYLRLDSVESAEHSLWTNMASRGPADFLADCSKAEVGQVMDLLLLFNLCHIVLWLCPGTAPRVDAESLRILSKLQELQLHIQLTPFLAERPVPAPAILLFVYADFKIPFLGYDTAERPPPLQLIETAECSLDIKWKRCLKRNLSDSKPSGLFRLQRPCVAVVPGPFASLDPAFIIDLFFELEEKELFPQVCGPDEDPLTVVAHATWPMDLFRSRLGELLEQLRGEMRKGPTLGQWMSSAHELFSNLTKTLEPSTALPSEISSIVMNGHAHRSKPTFLSEQGSRSELTTSLCWWSFSELLYSLGTSQKGFEEGFKTYCHGVQKYGPMYTAEAHEQQMKVAQQVLHHHACSPLNAAAAVAMRSRCDHHFNSRCLCKRRSLSGRPCCLLDGHTDDHRSNFRPTRVCLCGKSQMSRPDAFEVPRTPVLGLPPTAPCCYNVRFLPFLPLSCDFVADPVLIPTSPRLARTRPGASCALPSALPDANGFVALVADPPVKCDPVEGSRLPGFMDNFTQFNRWRVLSCDILSLNPSPPRYAYLGFEYACPQGQRFFVPPLKNSGLVVNCTAATRASRRVKRRRDRIRDEAQTHVLPGLLDEGEFEVAPLCSYRLFVPCVRHSKKEGSSRHGGEPLCVAQLKRLWIQTPPAGKQGELIEAAPRVSITDPSQEKGEDGQTQEVVCTGGKVALPHDSLVQLVLPTAYLSPEADGTFRPLPSFWDLSRSDAERCRLLPYTFWVSKPS